ncbi:MAG: glycosyltransferase [Bacteroidetes bacterium]|nr:glycosyltransferase [Bacteroidota bacterium]
MRVLQLIDSLDPGGAERVAVNYANALSTQIKTSFLCTTRKEGLLKQTLDEKVGYLFLKKKYTLDIKAMLRLVSFIKKNKIGIIHAHASSYFLATLVKMYGSKISVIWHDHYGKSEELKKRNYSILKWCSSKFCAIICVNHILEKWAKKNLKTAQVYFLENGVSLPSGSIENRLKLHGTHKKRIVCLANMRAQKDHKNLLDAFKLVIMKHPDYSLHLLGKNWDDSYFKEVAAFMELEIFREKVFYYGSQSDVYSILEQCDIGVLSSNSEGLPLALLEYGMANLAVVCTMVGQCEELVRTFGKCIPSKNPELLAKAINYYIEHPGEMERDAQNFNLHINKNYSIKTIIPKLVSYYETCS